MKKIIIPFIILFLASAVFLAWHETRLASPQGQNFWSVYFQNAKDNSLNFVIENNSDRTDFHWELTDGNNKVSEGDVKIIKGEKKEVNIANPNSVNKETITVTAENDKKQIYKILQ
jgi:hypothetical protein